VWDDDAEDDGVFVLDLLLLGVMEGVFVAVKDVEALFDPTACFKWLGGFPTPHLQVRLSVRHHARVPTSDMEMRRIA
jgi:hypothetical protein